MPVNTELSMKLWDRYQFVRDNGHSDYVSKAAKCDSFFQGLQWDPGDMAALKAARRPALTINKIIGTLGNVMGEQIQTRNDIQFLPRSGAPDQGPEMLSKVFRQISDANQLDWKRSEMFADGIISSRGFLDLRLDFTDNMQGEVRIETLNPKNVMIDPDAEEFDPDSWNDVFITKWLTWQDIQILYSAEDAKLLKDRTATFIPYGYDSIELNRDRFGTEHNAGFYLGPWEQNEVMRNIRVIERQYRLLDNQLHFVDPSSGDMRPIPEGWSRDKIAAVRAQFRLEVTKKLIKRIRWTIGADNVILHDDWSPYQHFTTIPYFPYFRRGKTIGLVENLLGPQEYLNKITSQELHVVNTTANSGWKVKVGALRNMTVEELEQKGATTGLVLEVDDVANIEKIQPNQTPTGLDRLSYKAEEHIKSISGVSDYQTGSAREDVSAKAVQLNQKAGSMNLAKPMDNLQRTDFLIARNILCLVQTFYTEPRVMNIIHDRLTGETESISVNEPQSDGSVLNDLTLGEYDVVVASTPHRETLEDSQFEQGRALRELGIPIPDNVLIENSRLNRRGEIIKQMQDAANSPEQQMQQQMQVMQQKLELANMKAEAARLESDAVLKQAKAVEAHAKAQKDSQGEDNSGELMKLQMEMKMAEQELEIERQKAEIELQMKREELELKRQEYAMKLQAAREQLEVDREKAAQSIQVGQQQADLKMQTQAAQASQQMEMADQQHSMAMEQQKESGKQQLQHTAEKSKAEVSAVKAKAKAAPKPAAKKG